MRNTLPVQSDTTYPRSIVKVYDNDGNGVILENWLGWEVENNTFYAADTFRLDLSVADLPAARDFSWWSSAKRVDVEIYAGYPADPDHYSIADLDLLIYGRADDIVTSLSRQKVEVSGRDLTSEFLDNKTTEAWQNLTASAIAEKLAARRGLTPVVTKTKAKAGTYYQIDHVHINNQRTEWDLLCYLAHQEQYIVYVQGKSLFFRPQPDASQDPYVIEYQPPTEENAIPSANCMDLSFARNLTLAKDVIVHVRSWNSKSKRAFTKTAKAKRKDSDGEAQVYSYTIPGKTPEEALQLAQAKLREITAHEVNLDATMPADNVLNGTDIIQVRGTNSAFDQTYYPDRITRSMRFEQGYIMTIHAKNHSPESVVSA